MQNPVFGQVNQSTVPKDITNDKLSTIAWIRDNQCKIEGLYDIDSKIASANSISSELSCVATNMASIITSAANICTFIPTLNCCISYIDSQINSIDIKHSSAITDINLVVSSSMCVYDSCDIKVTNKYNSINLLNSQHLDDSETLYNDYISCVSIHSQNLSTNYNNYISSLNSCTQTALDTYSSIQSCHSSYVSSAYTHIDNCINSCITQYDVTATNLHLPQIDCLSSNISSIISVIDNISQINCDAKSIRDNEQYIRDVSSNMCSIQKICGQDVYCVAFNMGLVQDIGSGMQNINRLGSQTTLNAICNVSDNISSINNASNNLSALAAYDDRVRNLLCLIGDLFFYDRNLVALNNVSLMYNDICCVSSNMSFITDFNSCSAIITNCVNNLNTITTTATDSVNALILRTRDNNDKLTCITDCIYPEMSSALINIDHKVSLSCNAASIAREWASNAESIEITGYPGEYSSKHYACKAKAFNCNYVDDLTISANKSWSSSKVSGLLSSIENQLVCEYVNYSTMDLCFTANSGSIPVGSNMIVSSDENNNNLKTGYIVKLDGSSNKILSFEYSEGTVQTINSLSDKNMCIYSPLDYHSDAEVLTQWGAL